MRASLSLIFNVLIACFCITLAMWFGIASLGLIAEPPRTMQMLALSFACCAALDHFVIAVTKRVKQEAK